jgi:hypothetical protein
MVMKTYVVRSDTRRHTSSWKDKAMKTEMTIFLGGAEGGARLEWTRTKNLRF